MENLNKLTVILIRLQSLVLILAGLIYWCLIAGLILIESVEGTQKMVNSYIPYIILGISYIVFGIILYARSRSLAHYFIRGVEKE